MKRENYLNFFGEDIMQRGIDRLGALDKAFEFIYKSETNGDFYEFGVYQGLSMLRAFQSDDRWRKKTSREHVNRFFGFDTFAGLPQLKEEDLLESYGVFQEGQFGDTSQELVLQRLSAEGVDLNRVQLTPGLFSQTLKPEILQQNLAILQIAIVHIDCDLYSSALDCLRFLDGRLTDGAVLLFDDWFCYRGRHDKGVRGAFEIWSRTNAYVFSEYFSYSWAGKAFIVNQDSASDFSGPEA